MFGRATITLALAHILVVVSFFLSFVHQMLTKMPAYIRIRPGDRLDEWSASLCSVLFCSLAVLDPKVGHTMDVISPFISILCHSH